jgi:hypothetical protein
MGNIQSRIEGAQGAATAGKENAMAGLSGAIEGIGGGAAGAYGGSDKVWGGEKNAGNKLKTNRGKSQQDMTGSIPGTTVSPFAGPLYSLAYPQ